MLGIDGLLPFGSDCLSQLRDDEAFGVRKLYVALRQRSPDSHISLILEEEVAVRDRPDEETGLEALA